LRVDAFDFDLPQSLIAMKPAEPRDAARLLVVAAGAAEDRHMADLPGLLRAGDVMVFNDTRVIPARLIGRRGTARIELTLHRRIDGSTWLAFAKGARRLRPGHRIDFSAPEETGFTAEIVAKNPQGDVTLRFDRGDHDLRAALERYGVMPLPPYIKRAHVDQEVGVEEGDLQSYQTIYAVNEGAVAAPTAGLHFTERLMRALDDAGIERVMVTLHVGAGTFLPVKVEDTREHRMHSEFATITAPAADRINAARRRGGRVVAVGTTSLRLLETAADEGGLVHSFEGDTDIFITPGYRFKAVDLLLTNFHLPRSTLFMLVSAFAGLDRMKAAYEHAKSAGYRFYSYGDACLLHPEEGRSPGTKSALPGESNRTSQIAPPPLRGREGWGVVPRLDPGGISALRDPPTLTLPRKGGGDMFCEKGSAEPIAIAAYPAGSAA
jgi:S-adenosylmethionine:tRNA ribosyltransferase-isomerase